MRAMTVTRIVAKRLPRPATGWHFQHAMALKMHDTSYTESVHSAATLLGVSKVLASAKRWVHINQLTPDRIRQGQATLNLERGAPENLKQKVADRNLGGVAHPTAVERPSRKRSGLA